MALILTEIQVALHLLARKPCFLAAEEWRTIPWTYQPKNLFDHAMDLLVQIPDLVASVDLFRKGELKPAAMDAQVRSFIKQLHSWKASILSHAAEDLFHTTTVDLDDLITTLQPNSPARFCFARGLTHYLAAILLISRFGPPYISHLPFPPDLCARSILNITEKMTLSSMPNDYSNPGSAASLWPWIQPLRIACFTPTGNEQTSRDLTELCMRLEKKFGWGILDSERYRMFQKESKK